MIRLLQMLGLLIEFGVESDDSAVGVLQLAIEVRQFVLPLPEIVQDLQQLMILDIDLMVRIFRRYAGEVCCELGSFSGVSLGLAPGAISPESRLSHGLAPYQCETHPSDAGA